jgi:NAD(P)H-flavin reductase
VEANGGALEIMPKDEDGNIDLKLTKKIKITEDTFVYRFSFDEKVTLGLPIGKHVIFSANIKTKSEPNGELVCRKYTPISFVKQRGYVDFLIKVYFSDVVPRFPDGGIMS